MDESLVQVSRIYRLEGESKVKAFVDVSLLGFVVKGMRVVEGKQGLFLGMPGRQGKDGRWYNSVIPGSKDLQKELEDIVLAAYKEQEA